MFGRIFNIFKGTKTEYEEPHFYEEHLELDEEADFDESYEEYEPENKHYFY
ncbi:hypothetical protein [Lederbergia lenta]|uniref:Uncharacterized protein n=1 Tax=Lederbergia lenta TaxID=1467 RepID=A0A2X4WA97_LEDLE|nr:hypothetical protein [Lederbergia lenta]MCM3109844.1 hypothetical protein [Lederbergia lenta]MEC2324382.1 hypothetical protein [Lederbergia lenta]SQI60071.1 Uncharacterised protein [Lederbergia lenta]